MDRIGGWSREDVEREYGDVIRSEQARMKAESNATPRGRVTAREVQLPSMDSSDTTVVLSISEDAWRLRVLGES